MPPQQKPNVGLEEDRTPVRVWTSEHGRLNDIIMSLIAEDPSWDLDKQGAVELFSERVATEMGESVQRYKNIFKAKKFFEHRLFISLKNYITRRYQEQKRFVNSFQQSAS